LLAEPGVVQGLGRTLEIGVGKERLHTVGFPGPLRSTSHHVRNG
jgi:hypothetical protein